MEHPGEGLGPGVPAAVEVAVAVGVPPEVEAVGLAVGTGVAVGEATAVAVGVGLGHDPSTTRNESTLHPVKLTLLSDAIRKRSLMVWPATFGPKFAIVLRYPPELPLHAIRPPIGLWKDVEMGPV